MADDGAAVVDRAAVEAGAAEVLLGDEATEGAPCWGISPYARASGPTLRAPAISMSTARLTAATTVPGDVRGAGR